IRFPFSCYLCLICFCACSGDHLDLHSFPTRRSSDLVMWLGNNIGEESLTEAAQSLTLVLVIATFVYIVAKHEDKRPFTYMALGLFISMLFREHDFMLNKMIDNLWEACVALTVITVVILARRTGKPFAPVFAAYLKSPAARIMAVALVLLVV